MVTILALLARTSSISRSGAIPFVKPEEKFSKANVDGNEKSCSEQVICESDSTQQQSAEGNHGLFTFFLCGNQPINFYKNLLGYVCLFQTTPDPLA